MMYCIQLNQKMDNVSNCLNYCHLISRCNMCLEKGCWAEKKIREDALPIDEKNDYLKAFTYPDTSHKFFDLAALLERRWSDISDQPTKAILGLPRLTSAH